MQKARSAHWHTHARFINLISWCCCDLVNSTKKITQWGVHECFAFFFLGVHDLPAQEGLHAIALRTLGVAFDRGDGTWEQAYAAVCIAEAVLARQNRMGAGLNVF